MNGTCMCPAGYTGPSCLDYVCECFAIAIMYVAISEGCIVIVVHLFKLVASGDPPCGNGGYCSYNNSCYCDYGFSGPRCEIRKCVFHTAAVMHVFECTALIMILSVNFFLPICSSRSCMW